MKEIAKSLTEVYNNKVMAVVRDRQKDIFSVTNDLLDWWRLDLFNRRPAPAFTADGFQGTDLDLATFMSTLADRGAVINIPTYKSMRQSTRKEGQVVTSKDNRHGKITGLTANQEVFTFGVRINDQNVMTTSSTGEPRVFNLTDLDGEWYKGWKKIEFIPTEKENKFIKEFQLQYGNVITFSNFVSPARSLSVFSAPYFITKAAINRLTEEAKYYGGLIDWMLQLGISYPKGKAPVEWPDQTKVGESKSIKVNATKWDIQFEMIGEYPLVIFNQDTLIKLTKLRKDIIYKIKPQLTFAVRACELAYQKYGKGKLPSWIKDAKWEPDFITPPSLNVNYNMMKKYKDIPNVHASLKMICDRSYPSVDAFMESYNYYKVGASKLSPPMIDKLKVIKSRTLWDRLVLFQPAVGKYGVSLLTRTYEKSEQVHENY